MNIFLKLFRGVARVVARLFDRPYRTRIVQDTLPGSLKRRMLYVVEDDGYFEQAALVCPCGCGRVLQMNLLPDSRPCWSVTQHSDGTASLHPSIWRQKDCKSHFWFRKSRIQWCPDATFKSI